MRLNILEDKVDIINKFRRQLIISKNHDYSKDEDAHSNFKEVAALCKILNVDVTTPCGCAQYHVVQKIHRKFKLMNTGAKPAHESLWDNTLDVHNYIDLLFTLYEEENE